MFVHARRCSRPELEPPLRDGRRARGLFHDGSGGGVRLLPTASRQVPPERTCRPRSPRGLPPRPLSCRRARGPGHRLALVGSRGSLLARDRAFAAQPFGRSPFTDSPDAPRRMVQAPIPRAGGRRAPLRRRREARARLGWKCARNVPSPHTRRRAPREPFSRVRRPGDGASPRERPHQQEGRGQARSRRDAMTARPYATPAAFKQALETRLKNASSTGLDFARRRQLLVFERFLARIVPHFGNAATLKGGLALELRLERARTTKD